MIRFYSFDIITSSALPEVESVHCCRVLRMKAGDEIEVVDGKGNIYKCKILTANPRNTELEIISVTSEPRHWLPYLTLAVAPTKNIDRIEWLVEKAIEIGVDKIVFMNCHNSVRRVVKRERIEKIMISAMKQSLKARLPELIEMIDFKEFVVSDNSSLKFVGYCDESLPREDFAFAYDGKSDLTIMIGPEGDFSSDEIREALKAGYQPVTFGNTRLRTETAALYGLCSAHTLMTLKN